MPADAPFEPGFNAKTLWAALFVGFVMLPGAIYLGLVTGMSMAGGAEWVTLILFIEMAKRTFVYLRTQEIIILYWVAGGLVMMGGKLGTGADLFGGPFGVLIWDQYLIQSPQADGLAEHIPTWVVPPRGSEALLERSFLDSAWLKPIVILLCAVALQRVNALSLGYVLFRITHDIERLPFPMAYVQAGGATALAETSAKQEGWRWHVFSTGAFIGAVWGVFYVVVPTLSSVFSNRDRVDFADSLHRLHRAAKGGFARRGHRLGHGFDPRAIRPRAAVLGRSRSVCFVDLSQLGRQPHPLCLRYPAHLGAGHVVNPHPDRQYL